MLSRAQSRTVSRPAEPQFVSLGGDGARLGWSQGTLELGSDVATGSSTLWICRRARGVHADCPSQGDDLARIRYERERVAHELELAGLLDEFAVDGRQLRDAGMGALAP